MYFSDNFLDNIKHKLPLSSVISRKAKLIRRGNRIVALCPFHNEKTPSFSVNDSEGYYYCFGCHAKGDIFQFIMETEKMNFSEAVIYLSQMANVTLPVLAKPEKSDQNSVNILTILAKATEWFIRQLNIISGEEARNYLIQRKLPQNVINQSLIGFAPPHLTALYDYLRDHNFATVDILKAGLIIEKNGQYIDKFRNRIMFPITNANDRILAFGGRVITGGIPKYLNSPDTEVFKKSNLLYAENIAKRSARKLGNLLVVEGYMDCLTLHAHDFTYTVAVLGTAISESHLKRMWNICDEPTICFDGDEAGLNAAYRVAKLALPILAEGQSLKFVLLPPGDDPDTIINNYGRDFFKSHLEKTTPLSEIIWRIATSDLQRHTPEKIAALEKNLADVTANIANYRVQKNYRHFFNGKVWELTRQKRDKITKSSFKQIDVIDDLSLRYEHILLAEALYNPNILCHKDINENLSLINFTQDELTRIRAILFDYFIQLSDKTQIDKKELKNFIIDKGLEQYYNKLVGQQSHFIDRLSHNKISNIIKNWLILHKKYTISLMENEYKIILGNDYNQEKLTFLRDEINHSCQKIKYLELEEN